MRVSLRPPASIRNRLVAIFAVSAAILLVLTGALLYIGFDAQLDGAIDQTLGDRAADITADLHAGDVQIRSGEPFAVLLDPDSGQVYELTSAEYELYDRNRAHYEMSNLELLPDNNYDLWMQPPLNSSEIK